MTHPSGFGGFRPGNHGRPPRGLVPVSARAAAAVAILLALTWPGAATAREAPDLTSAPPPAPYARVSSLVPLPDFIPGLGTLFVDPSTLPVGPFLAYDREGSLVALVFMVPLDDLNARRQWTELISSVTGWFPVQHVDLDYNPGHPGVEKPHYHITLWAIRHADEQRRVR